MTKQANTAKPAIKQARKPIITKPATDKHAGKSADVAKALATDASEHYKALNTAFLSKYNKRPIFGEKRPTAIDLSKHNPVSPTDRDNAFIHAIKTVYNTKPFTAADLRADTGNIARAVKLGMLQSLGIIDGAEQFKLATNKA